ncbi:MAG: right-handed parallel beta-helix repeat-containing protein [Fimbriimonadaceae bacterium]
MVLASLLVPMLASAVVNVTPGGPIKTLGGGLDEARRIHRNNQEPVEIRVATGDYRIESTVSLTAQDSNVRIVGVGPSLPKFIGGKWLNQWHSVNNRAILARLTPDARTHVQECDLTGDDAISNLGELTERGFDHPTVDAGLELFFDHKPMQLARYPNSDAPDGGFLRITRVANGDEITYPGDEPRRWQPSDDIWALGYWQFDWAESYERVTRLDTHRRTAEFRAAHFSYPPLPGRRFYFLNVLEELDEPGEWYLDRTTRKVYFWPPFPIERGEVIASTLDGPMFKEDGASNVEISGLDLEAGRGGGVDIAGGSHDWLRNCVVRNFGTFGVSIINAPGSGVSGCDLTGLGDYGIQLSGGDRKTLSPGNLVAEDNHIWAYSRWRRTYQPAVIMYGVGNVARHNLIHDAPHQAILISGNDHVVEYNDIANVCQETGDAGAIYMGRDTTMRGDIIRFNRFHDLTPHVSTAGNFTEVIAVYLDDCWAGTTIYGNIFDVRGDGVMLGGGRDNTIANNVFLDCHPSIHFDARGKGWAAKFFAPSGEWSFYKKIADMNVSRPPYSTRYPRLANILSEDAAFPAGNTVDANVCLGGQWLRLLDNLTTKDFENRNNVVSPKTGTLANALKVAPSSFARIPVNKIGLITKKRPIDRVTG